MSIITYTLRLRNSKIYFNGPTSVDVPRGKAKLHNTGNVPLYIHVGWDVYPEVTMLTLQPGQTAPFTIRDQHVCVGCTKDLNHSDKDIPIISLPSCGWEVNVTQNGVETKIHNNKPPVYIIREVCKHFIVKNTSTGNAWLSSQISIHPPTQPSITYRGKPPIPRKRRNSW